MPVVQSERISVGPSPTKASSSKTPLSSPSKAHASSSKALGAGSSNKLRSLTSAEASVWKKAVDDSSLRAYEFFDLFESLEYPFKDQDPVWVCTKDQKWYFGKVCGRSPRMGQTEGHHQGFFYPVIYGSKSNLRKYFAPLNGEIKPDSEEVRELLRFGGWIDDDDETMSDGGSAYTES